MATHHADGGGSAVSTTDHAVIKRWIEERGGRPATVKGTHHGDDAGILRVDFGEPDPGLEPVGWDEFFHTFEDRGLAFLHQDRVDGKASRFFKFVRR
jgi:hypothetical protein